MQQCYQSPFRQCPPRSGCGHFAENDQRRLVLLNRKCLQCGRIELHEYRTQPTQCLVKFLRRFLMLVSQRLRRAGVLGGRGQCSMYVATTCFPMRRVLGTCLLERRTPLRNAPAQGATTPSGPRRRPPSRHRAARTIPGRFLRRRHRGPCGCRSLLAIEGDDPLSQPDCLLPAGTHDGILLPITP